MPGGGGKEGFAGGSGDGRCIVKTDVILGDGVDTGAKLCSKAALTGRCCRLLGGLYGGGGGAGAVNEFNRKFRGIK